MASRRSQKTLVFLEEWLDGTTIHRVAATFNDNDTTTSFAWNLYDNLLKLLSTLVPVILARSSRLSRKSARSLKESLGNLFLWGDGFRNGLLEIILEQSDDLRRSVISLLVSVGTILITGRFYNVKDCLVKGSKLTKQ